ncbi:MAG: hypothetical protein LBF22_00405 [Deltaproteobacteria bacterium]|jgi:hypothetical protein|nr:hypothetical protein [Deltaproteobacteria bacterium]
MFIKYITKTTIYSAGQEQTCKNFFLKEKKKNPLTKKFEETLNLDLTPLFNTEKLLLEPSLWSFLCTLVETLLLSSSKRAKRLFVNKDPALYRLWAPALRIVRQIDGQRHAKSLLEDPEDKWIKLKDFYTEFTETGHEMKFRNSYKGSDFSKAQLEACLLPHYTDNWPWLKKTGRIATVKINEMPKKPKKPKKKVFGNIRFFYSF